MKKKVLALALAAAMMTGIMTGCTKNEPAPPPAPEQGESTPAENGGSDDNSASTGSFEEQKLKMNITTAETTTWYDAATKMADAIKEDTGGAVQITVYPNEQLSGGNQSKGVEMVMSGATDVDIHSNIIYSVVDERFSLFSLPFFFENVEDADSKLKGEGAEAIKKLMADKGVQWIGFGESGMRQITNNVKEIKTVDDLKGLKIRIPGMNLYVKTYQAMGANPISMNWSEVFTSLQQGAIDGQENPTDLIYGQGVHEVQKYMTLWDYSYDCLLFGVNKKLYDSWPAELQAIFDARGQEYGDYQKQLARQENDNAVKKIEEAGVQVYTPTSEERQTFIDATKGVIEEYTGIIGEEYLAPFTVAE